MYVNGMGFRGISRVTGVAHTTIINQVKQVGKLLPDTYEAEDTPQVGEVDELQTFIGKKKQSLDLDSAFIIFGQEFLAGQQGTEVLKLSSFFGKRSLIGNVTWWVSDGNPVLG